MLRILFLLTFCANSLTAQPVYKTPSGAKYHLASCRTVNNVSEKITIEQAIKLGLEPCKICKPPVDTNMLLSSTNKAKGENITTQCKGITKTGTRCQHMTKIANGYCFQHNPDKE